MDQITKALQAFQHYDACDACGKRTDGLMTCIYPSDGSKIKLCPDCMNDSGFCLMCGSFCAGIESFDFSDMPGYCSDCREEIMSEFDDDENDWEPENEWSDHIDWDEDYDSKHEDNNLND